MAKRKTNKNKKSQKRTNHFFQMPQDTIKTARLFRKSIGIAAGLLATAFTVLTITKEDMFVAVHNIPATVLFNSSLVIYYFSWVFGPASDLNAQELVFPKPPSTLNKESIFIISIITSVFGLLCWVGDKNPKWFSIVLLIFWTIDFLSVRFYLSKKILNGANDVKKNIGNNLIAKIQLNTVVNMAAGKWRMTRFYAGFVGIALLLILTFGGLSNQIATITNFSIESIFAIAVFCFVIAVELSIWKKRLETNAVMDAIKNALTSESISNSQ